MRTRPLLAKVFVVALFCAGAGARAGASEPEAVTPWHTSGRAAARLLVAGPAQGGAAKGGADLAGVEIRLDPGFITYWRNPGEAGLPPSFDTSASENVAAVSVDFPAPRALDEGGSEAFGYTGGVTFPLHVTRADPSRPAVLVVELGYAVCEKLCLPASASLRLSLPDGPVPDVAARLDAALAEVPRPAAVGGVGALAITGVTGVTEDGFDLSARAGPAAALFVEAPDGWFLETGPGRPAGPDAIGFHVAVAQRPDGARLAGLDLRFTLVDPTGAIDVPLRVDASAPRR